MAQCTYCNAETQLHLSNVPVCVKCANARTPEQKRARLLQNVANATMRADAASEAFQKVVEEIPKGMPHDYSAEHIKNVSRELSEARDEMLEAHRLLDDQIEHDEF